MIAFNRIALVLAAVFSGSILFGAPTFAQQVGTTGAVNPASKAVLRGNIRVLELGSPIIYNEHLQTSAAGSLQVVFIDKTTLSIGPSSDVTIDSFVYDPGSGTGKMSLTLGKGLMRVVGGNTSHTGGATVNTPVATIGIRGGVATIAHSPKKGTQAVNIYGTITVASKGMPGAPQP